MQGFLQFESFGPCLAPLKLCENVVRIYHVPLPLVSHYKLINLVPILVKPRVACGEYKVMKRLGL